MSKINPDHYKLPNGIEANDVTRYFGFNEGNVLKYVWRAGKKEGEHRLTDLKKALWYLNQLVEKEELDAVSNEEVLPPLPRLNGLGGNYFVSDYFTANEIDKWRDAT